MAESVGTELRHARERAHLSLHDLAARTKIRVPLLEAIEREHFERLPAGLLTRGYLRAYAREVGLDPESIVRQYVAEYEPERLAPVRPREELPDAVWDSDDPPARTKWAMLAPAIPLILAAIFVVRVNRAPEIAPAAATAALGPVATTGEQRMAVDQAPPVGNRLPFDVAQGTPSARRGVRLDIHPTGPTWVEATADGTRVLGELIDVGQSRVVEADREIVLRIGDAAAFAYSINGMPGRSLGGPGQVRDIRIIRDNVADFLMP